MKFEIDKDGNDNFIYSASQNIMTQIVKQQDEATRKAIEKYCEENNIIPNIIEKEKLDLVLKLGIQALNERELKENYDIIDIYNNIMQ